MGTLSRGDVEHVAHLARLGLADEELARLETAPIDQDTVWNVSYATSRQWMATAPVPTRTVKTS